MGDTILFVIAEVPCTVAQLPLPIPDGQLRTVLQIIVLISSVVEKQEPRFQYLSVPRTNLGLQTYAWETSLVFSK